MLQAKSYGPWLWDLHTHNENASLLASLGFMNCNKWRSFSIGTTDICYKCSADNFTPITLWSHLLTLKVSVCKYHWSVSSKNWYRWRLQIPISGRFVCTTKNDDTRRYSYMYIIVWRNNAWQDIGGMGIFTLYEPQPSHFSKAWRFPEVTSWKHVTLYFALFSALPIQGWLSSRNTPTLITQFFVPKFIKVELNSNHWKLFPNCWTNFWFWD